ncbi:MAG TPA: carboxypeptidase regulatory-like domain-containing protein [Kofleriaceae bacterium]
MRERGIAIVVLLIAGIVGGIWWWKSKSDTPATPALTQPKSGSGSGATAKPGPAATGSLAITVKSAKGPLADATVRIAPEDGEVIVVKTGADGIARASQLAQGRYAISGSATGYEPAALPARELTTGEAAELALTLVAGGRVLSGTVSDVSGGPIAGARIDAAKFTGRVRDTTAIATTLTGPDGKYKLTVSEGQLMVAARSADYAAQSRTVEVGEAGATADFALVPGGVIEGIVRDEKSKQPVPGALVDAERDSPAIMLAESGGHHVVAGADGRFRIAGLRPGAYELAARHDALRTKTPTLVGLGIAEQVSDVELLVGVGPVVRGKVVDESQAPVANAKIIVMGERGADDVKSDAKGEFVIFGLAPGSYGLAANGTDHLAATPSRVTVADKDVDDVIVRVERGIKLRGHVEPRQVADVSFEPDLEGRGGMIMRRMGGGPTTTGPDGEFEIVVGAGKATLSARCPSGDQGSQQLDVKPAMGPVTLAVTPGGSIAGRVVDGDGKPVANASVMAASQADDESMKIVNGVVTSGVQALTTGTGAYEIRGLPPGSYRLSVLDRGKPARMPKKAPLVKLAAAEKKTGIDLAIDRPNGVIKGVVTGPDGKPLADAWVSVNQDLASILGDLPDRDDDGPERRRMVSVESGGDGDGGGGGGGFTPALTDAQGRFEIAGLPHATFDVFAEAQAGKLRGRAEGIKPDATVNIQALGVTSVSGKVTGTTGPVALFSVELVGPTRARRSFTDGTFSFARVDPGDYVVRVSSSAGNGEGKVTVKAATPATVDIALVANAIVIGTLVDGTGKPLPGLPVAVLPESPDGRVEIRLEGPPPTSGPDGKFRIEHKAGPSMLLVLGGQRPTTKRGLALEAGKTFDAGEIRVAIGQAPPP